MRLPCYTAPLRCFIATGDLQAVPQAAGATDAAIPWLGGGEHGAMLTGACLQLPWLTFSLAVLVSGMQTVFQPGVHNGQPPACFPTACSPCPWPCQPSCLSHLTLGDSTRPYRPQDFETKLQGEEAKQQQQQQQSQQEQQQSRQPGRDQQQQDQGEGQEAQEGGGNEDDQPQEAELQQQSQQQSEGQAKEGQQQVRCCHALLCCATNVWTGVPWAAVVPRRAFNQLPASLAQLA